MNATGPTAARRRRISSESTGWVRTSDTERLPFRVEAVAPLDLAAWATDHVTSVDDWLHRYGAVVFSGFVGQLDPDRFGAVCTALLGTEPSEYRERSSPRRELAPGVYTSTEQPADQPIVLHNENAYQQALPTRLVFGCVAAAPTGGATPIADCGLVLRRLPPPLVDRFRSAGVRYVRHFGHGIGLSWQETFGTEDPAQVDRYCADRDIATHWSDTGRLRTTQVRPAIVRHPAIGSEIWLNHVLLFGPYGTTPQVRSALVDRFGQDGLPMHVSFGDGAPIGDDDHRSIRDAFATETVAQPWRDGDVLLVDNLRVAHARESFEGHREILVGMAGSFTTVGPT